MVRRWIAVLLISQPFTCHAESAHAPIGGDLISTGMSTFSAYVTDVNKLKSFGNPVAVLTKPSVKDETSSIILALGLSEATLQTIVDKSFARYFGTIPRSDVSKLRGPREDVGMFGCEVMLIARALQSAFEVKCQLGSHALDPKRKPLKDTRLGFADTPALKESIADAIDQSTKSLSEFFQRAHQ